MLDALKPSVLVFAKLDVWPNLVCVAAERGVRTALLSATMAPGSGRQGAFAKALLRDAYAALDVVGAIDAENAARLAQLGVHNDRVQVSGDTRFDQVFARAQHVDRLTALLQSLQSDRPTLVAGSTWPADEEVLLPAWVEIKARIPSVRIIIAPHEPTPAHVGPIQDWAKQHKLSAATLTELSGRTNGDVDVIIVDRVGVLGDIYAIADVAFVGGAFHRAGLHSVIEPAAFGTPVVFGPAYQMSREAGLLLNRGGAVSVSSREQCVAALFSYFSDDAGRTRAGVNAKAVVESELGAAQRSLHLLIGLLRRS